MVSGNYFTGGGENPRHAAREPWSRRRIDGVGGMTDPPQRHDSNHPQVVSQHIGMMFESDHDPVHVAGETPLPSAGDATLATHRRDNIIRNFLFFFRNDHRKL